MRFFKLFLIKLVVFTFCFDFVYSQNPLNDPRFKEVLNQSGISVEDAKELLGNDRFQDKYSNSDNIKAPGKNIDDVAYGTCTNRVKGVKNKTGKRKALS